MPTSARYWSRRSRPYSPQEIANLLRNAPDRLGVARVWGSAWHRAGVAGRDAMVAAWRDAADGLRQAGDEKRAAWVDKVAADELAAVTEARADALERRRLNYNAKRRAARHAEGRTVPGGPRVGGLPPTGEGKTKQVRVPGDLKVAMQPEMVRALDSTASLMGTSRYLLMAQYLARALGSSDADVAAAIAEANAAASRENIRRRIASGGGSDEPLLTSMVRTAAKSGVSAAEVVRQAVRSGLAADGFEVKQDA